MISDQPKCLRRMASDLTAHCASRVCFKLIYGNVSLDWAMIQERSWLRVANAQRIVRLSALHRYSWDIVVGIVHGVMSNLRKASQPGG